MRRPRFQFRLSTLLWITLAVACWFGGTRYGVYRDRLKRQRDFDRELRAMEETRIPGRYRVIDE